MLPCRAATDVRPAITDEKEQLLDAGTFTFCLRGPLSQDSTCILFLLLFHC